MRTLRASAALASICASSFLAGVMPRQAAAAAPCRAHVQSSLKLTERVDGLLALQPDASAIALAAPSGSRPVGLAARFLPHDDLLLLPRFGRRGTTTVRLPAYSTPPGMSLSPGTEDAYVLLDSQLLLLDARSGRIRFRWQLDVQALGWPAAMTVMDAQRLYVAGQPHQNTPSAVVEALDAAPGRPIHVLWRRSLGLTHAGTWLGSDGADRVVAYLPDAHDLTGTIELLDARSGMPLGTKAVPAPPVALDPRAERLYVAVGSDIRAFSLVRGAPSAGAPGSLPIAVDPSRGLVAFRRNQALVLASSRTLRTLDVVPLPSLTALAFTPNGRSSASQLLAARNGELLRIDLAPCSSP